MDFKKSTLRKRAHHEFQNEVTSAYVELTVFYPLLNGCDPYKWLKEFVDYERPGNGKTYFEHPLFRILIKNKLKIYPIEQRKHYVLEVMKKLTYAEVAEFCYGMSEEAVSYTSDHTEEIKRKQQYVALVVDDDTAGNELLSIKHSLIVDPSEEIPASIIAGEYIENGGEVPENFQASLETVVFQQTSETDNGMPNSSEGETENDAQASNSHEEILVPDMNFDARPTMNGLIQELQHEALVDERIFYEKRAEDPVVATLEEVKQNKVYEVSNRKYTKTSFPIMIYAPPGSGKTTYNIKERVFLDTDSLFLWQTQHSNGLYLTNMPHLLDKSLFSIAIIPDKSTFMQRCLDRGLEPTEEWYTGMIRETNKCDVKILTNKFLGELSCIGDLRPP